MEARATSLQHWFQAYKKFPTFQNLTWPMNDSAQLTLQLDSVTDVYTLVYEYTNTAVALV